MNSNFSLNEHVSSPVPRISVLASGSGTNLQALLDATACGTLRAEVAVVVSDRPDAGAIQRAAAAGVAAVSLPLANRRDPVAREAYDRRLAEVLRAFAPDLIVLAGWMLIFTPSFLETFPRRVVNAEVLTSHGRLPALRGPRAVRDALRRRLPVTGATVHYVTTTVDSGPVILREEVPVLLEDDEVRLHERIKSVERRLLPRAVAMALAEVSVAYVER
ncbi:MAG: phosphoribosylglycinamide formyltransferase [Thermomicrobiales bacterium]|nr:phosphoribosylglycinamide formyltransferase [Thermomicrobiales bacterium]